MASWPFNAEGAEGNEEGAETDGKSVSLLTPRPLRSFSPFSALKSNADPLTVAVGTG
jgi:hypothetical protein